MFSREFPTGATKHTLYQIRKEVETRQETTTEFLMEIDSQITHASLSLEKFSHCDRLCCRSSPNVSLSVSLRMKCLVSY